MLAMLEDLGYDVKGEVWGDARAALGVISCKGVGKTRRIDIVFLWVQQTAVEQRFPYSMVFGNDNPAGLCTNVSDIATIGAHARSLEYEYARGDQYKHRSYMQ